MPHDLVPFDDAPLSWRTRRQLARAHSAQLSTNLAVFRHGLEAQARAEMDAQDSQAVTDAAHTSLTEVLALLRDGLNEAGQSAAGVELVSRKVELVDSINNRRIARRFGA
jgi:hypothetical protein